METTEGKTIPEALRMIAQWIDEGKEIEVFENHTGPFNIYRAKPRKPRIGEMVNTSTCFRLPMEGVELTPEVRACLEKEGLI